MPKIGIKLWSINIEVLSQVSDMYSRAIFDYIELYFVPGTLQKIEEYWTGLKVPMVVHVPHFGHGFNLANKDLVASNFEIFEDTIRCADVLNSDTIIVHGGNGGTKEETIRQLKSLRDPRVLIENKPKEGLNGKECIGYTPEDIIEIVDKCSLSGFVLDFNHAVCAARSLFCDPLEYIRRFLVIGPKMFHLGDGDYFSLVDIHEHLGKGDMPLKEFITFLPGGAQVTIETPNDFSKGLRDFENNRGYFSLLLRAPEKVN